MTIDLSLFAFFAAFVVAATAFSRPALAAAAGTASVTGAIAWPGENEFILEEGKSQFEKRNHRSLIRFFPRRKKKTPDPSLADPASLELRLTPLDGRDDDGSSSSSSLTTWPRASDGGLFAFHGVPRGRAYSLDVSSPALVFPRVLVEVLESEKKEEEEEEGGKKSASFRAWLVAPLADVAAAVGGGGGAAGGGIAGGGVGGVVTAPRDPTATSTAVPLPLESFTRKKTGAGDTTETLPVLVLRPTARATFFEAPQPFNLVAFLKTPYGMLIGFVAFAVFALPRMKIDPDEYEELLGGGGGGGGGGSAAANNNDNNGAAAAAAPSPPRRQLPAGGGAGGSSPSGLRQRRA